MDDRIRDVVRSVVARIIEGYEPQKVVLFGSAAYGEPDADSDIDLLIIKDTAEPYLERMDTVRRLAAGSHPRIAFDPFVLTPREIEERLRIGDQFVAEIIERGQVLYAA